MSVEEFVKTPILGSYPVTTASLYSGDLDKVEKLIIDPEYSEFRPNITALLGVIGNKGTVRLLAGIIDSPFVKKPSDADIDTLLAAEIAIGTIVYRNNLPETDVQVLLRAANPAFWYSKLISFNGTGNQISQDNVLDNQGLLPAERGQSDRMSLDDQDIDNIVNMLTSQALKGYAISGSRSVKKELNAFKSASNNAAIPDEIRNNYNNKIDEIIELHKKSNLDGALSTYY
ncbi:hypothetical protein C2U68_09575 [Methylomonas koyamae]|nr:hypothetical protein C2U68_09575 [Methylomonas koyamae]